ncbi:Eukaryotic translation initiation factor 4E type 6 [Novymonas esmeraldas]|uniref:Eukaryotic translation initiation factor 4E type 6 n=1 Tax=Novymonas esmeraldas TaxID=1808958 RepID=A0AAW0F3J0_9TRYP
MADSSSTTTTAVEESSTTTPLHPLKDKWFVFYIPASKAGEYEHETKELGYVSSIEEVYGTINTLPPITLLPNDDNIVFARNKIEPQYESFPNGMRFSIFCKTKAQCREATTYVVAVVLGESMSREVCKGESPCDIVRIGHKGSAMYKDSVRIEIWAHQSPHTAAMEKHLTSIISSIPGISMSVRPFK